MAAEIETELVVHNRGGLFLVNTVGVDFQGNLITERMLDEDRSKWGTTALLTGTNNFHQSDTDEGVLRKALNELTPLTVVGRASGRPLILAAELERFPFTIGGVPGYEEYGIRLIPKVGEINRIIVNENPHGVVTTKRIYSLSLDVGGVVHIELYTVIPRWLKLPSLTPTSNFRENRPSVLEF